MIIKPLDKPQTPKPFAIILAAGVNGLFVVTSDGEVYRRKRGASARQALQEMRRHVVYNATTPRHLLVATDARYWEAKLWQGKTTSLRLDGGPKVVPLRKVFDETTSPDDAIASLTTISNFLTERGVVLGSYSSMAWNLWRRTLESPQTIYGPTIRESLYGGRKEARYPGEYHDVSYWDLSAAYPTEMAAAPFPVRLREVLPTTARTGYGFSYVRIAIPKCNWGPLPVSIGHGITCYGYGEAEGWWSWGELRNAEAMGCEVLATYSSFVGYEPVDLFGKWWADVAPLRKERGPAGNIAKAITSALWGQFALSESTSHTVRWADEWAKHPVMVTTPPRRLPQNWTVHIASEITARVRVKLLNEALRPIDSALYCDTDSVICASTESPNGPTWTQKKGVMKYVDIRGPQAYRYRCPTCGIDHPEWHYTVGGIASREGAERIFRRENKRYGHGLLTLARDGLSLPAMSITKAKEMVGQ